jgi:Xaa-Pro aminopeptidase
MTIPPAEGAASGSALLITPPAPLDGFAAEEFRARRAALAAACPDGIVLVRGTTEDEVVSPGTYLQNSNFFYLTGVSTPGAFLVLLPADVPVRTGLRDMKPGTRELLFLPARNPATETWTGAQWGPGEETEKATGIEKTVEAGAIWSALTGWLARCPVVYTVAPYGAGARGTREYALMARIAEAAPIVQFRDVAPQIARLRVVKSAAEIERIAQAVEVTAAGQQAARELILLGDGRWEYEVEAAVFSAFRARGAGLAFATIAGAGVNGTVLHYEANRAKLQDGDAVVVDIGALVGRYCGDLTRTYPVGGRFSPRQREVYGLVLAAHRHVVESFRHGEDTLRDLTDRCKAFLKESPLRAKDAAGVEKTMDEFMPHGLSHHLGLDVHDVGDREAPLTPGNVITIEPGLYIPTEGIGVRLEDDYLVTETGLKRLGPELPMEIEEALSVER